MQHANNIQNQIKDEIANEHDVQNHVDVHKNTSDHIGILSWDRRIK